MPWGMGCPAFSCAPFKAVLHVPTHTILQAPGAWCMINSSRLLHLLNFYALFTPSTRNYLAQISKQLLGTNYTTKLVLHNKRLQNSSGLKQTITYDFSSLCGLSGGQLVQAGLSWGWLCSKAAVPGCSRLRNFPGYGNCFKTGAVPSIPECLVTLG